MPDPVWTPGGNSVGPAPGFTAYDPTKPLTLDQIIEMNKTGGVAIGSPNDKLLEQAGIENSLGPRTAPTPAPSGGGSSTTAGDMLTPNIPPPVNLGGPAGIPYVPPTPNFTPPGYTKPPPFVLPTADQAASDPGYQFTLKQGLGAYQNSAAAQGILDTGGVAKGLEDYGQAAAATQYNNVMNRMIQQYNTNYQTQYIDPYNIAFQNATAQFAPQLLGYQTQAAAGQHQTDLNTATAFNTWLQDWNMKYGAATAQ